MSTQNFFALLGDDENEDPAAVVVRATSIPAAGGDKTAAAATNKKPQQQTGAAAKLSSKPAAVPADAGMCVSALCADEFVGVTWLCNCVFRGAGLCFYLDDGWKPKCKPQGLHLHGACMW